MDPGNPSESPPGRLVRWEDRSGNAIVITYQFPRTATDADLGFDREKLWIRNTMTDAYGKVMTFHYSKPSTRWVATSIDVPNGTTIFYDYTGNDLTAVRYPDGSKSTFTTVVDSVHQTLNKVIVEAGETGTHRRKTVYLSQSTWVDPTTGAITNQVGGMVRRIDNGAGQMTYFSEQDPANIDVYYIYNGGNELLRHTDQNGPDHEISDEVSTTFVLGQPIPTTGWQLISGYQNDPSKGRLIPTTWTDILGRQTKFTFDLKTGARLGKIYPDGSSDSTAYNAFSQPLHQVDRIGRVTDSTYDAKGNRLTRTAAVGTTAQATWSWTYNARGQMTKAKDALFDPSIATRHATDYTYDAAGFLTTITMSDDVPGTPRFTKAFTYDSAGRLKTSKDEGNRTVTYGYDTRNRLISITYPDSSTEAFTYAITGVDVNLLTRRTDRNGNVTAFTYDGAGRKTGETSKGPGVSDPVLGTRSWTYLTGTAQMASATDNGDTTTFTYDYRNRLVANRRKPTSATSLLSTTTFDNAQRIASTMDPYGRKQYRVYDLNDRVVRTVQDLIPGGVPGGANLTTLARITTANPPYVIEDTTYDAAGQTLSRTDGRGNATSFVYDAQGRQIRVTEPTVNGVIAKTETDYDAQGNRIEVRSPRHFVETGGFRTAYVYTGRNLLKTVTEAVGRGVQAVTTYTYSPTGKTATVKDARANTTTYGYGTCCDRLVSVTDPAGNVATIAYDPVGNVIARTDENLLTTAFTYDARNRLTSTTNAAGETTRSTYFDNATALGAVVSGLGLGAGADGFAVKVTNAIQPIGEDSITIKDGLGRTVRLVDGNGNLTTTTYDVVESSLVKIVVTDALNHAVKKYADGLGRVRQTKDALDQISTTGFDPNGNQLRSRDPNGIGEDCVYDARNRKTDCTDTKGAHQGWGYDTNGNVTSLTDGLAHATTMTYDPRDRKTATVDRLGGSTTFAYDGNGNLLNIIDAQGKVTSYLYEVRNLLTTETYPAGQQTPGTADQRTYAYDPARRLKTRTDQATVVTAYGYDNANRLTSRSYSDGLGNDSFTYDRASRLLTAVSGRYGTTVTRNYILNSERAGRLCQEQLSFAAAPAATYTVGYGYDSANRSVSVTYPNAQVVTRSFTERDQLSQVFYGPAGSPSNVASRTYDSGMRLTQAILGNGLTETRTYVPNDNMVQTIGVPGVTAFGYSYDADKRKTAEAHQFPADNQTFGYDNESRATSWTRDGIESQNWTLSLVSDWNATTRTGPSAFSQARTHSDVHEIISITQSGSTTVPTYDKKGNLTADPTSGLIGLAWDAENRLTVATGPGGTGAYTYDALGRRVAKTVGATTTRFVHDGPQVVVEYDNNVAARSYVYGSYVDEPMMLVNGSTKYYYHSNNFYSVAALTNAAGAVQERYRFDAYGKRTVLAQDGVTVRVGSTIGNQVGFTGRYLDQETGLWYFRARMYSPALGRFIGRDPIGRLAIVLDESGLVSIPASGRGIQVIIPDRPYRDGYNLYNGWFVPNGTDPTGLLSACTEGTAGLLETAVVVAPCYRKCNVTPSCWKMWCNDVDGAGEADQQFVCKYKGIENKYETINGARVWSGWRKIYDWERNGPPANKRSCKVDDCASGCTNNGTFWY